MITNKLFEMQDISYRDFNAKLLPGVPFESIIGVRTPLLRSFAKAINGSGEAKEFMDTLPHQYYEENNLHAFLIEHIKEYDECIAELNRFLPYVDNWGTCDCMNPKILKKHPDKLIGEIESWLSSQNTFTVRYGIKKLMDHFLDENFKSEYLEMVAVIRSDEYYIKMMKAWYFATALAKQYDDAILYIKEKRLSIWEHNKTIQKAIESYRISEGKKELLKSMRIKQ